MTEVCLHSPWCRVCPSITVVDGAVESPAATDAGWRAALGQPDDLGDRDDRLPLEEQEAAWDALLRADRDQILAASRLWREAARRLQVRV